MFKASVFSSHLSPNTSCRTENEKWIENATRKGDTERKIRTEWRLDTCFPNLTKLCTGCIRGTKPVKDIVQLNVRGRHFDFHRSTLCQVKGSLLEVIFHGNLDSGLEKDSSGRAFFDFNSTHFERVLDFLWAFQLAERGERTAYPSLDIEEKQTFEILVEYLGLEDILLHPEKFFSLSLKTSFIRVMGNGQIAVQKAGGDTYQTAYSHSVFEKDIVQINLKILRLRNALGWIMIGVIPAQSNATNSSHKTSGSYGWCADGKRWIRGEASACSALISNILKEDKEVVLTLDCRQGYDSLLLQESGTKQAFEIPFMPKNQWRLQVVLYGNNDTIQIQDVTYPSCNDPETHEANIHS
eukprot:g815.t1